MTAKRKRSGISVDRAFRIQSLLKERLESIYREAVHFKLTHEEITDCVNARVFHSVARSTDESPALDARPLLKS